LWILSLLFNTKLKETRNILLFDGVCNLCNSAVQFVLKRDKKQTIQFASLQSKAGENLLEYHHLSQSSMNSFVYIRRNKPMLKSTAALYLAKDLGGIMGLLFVFIIIPKPIRDFVYSIIANNRYKWFGKQATCMIPSIDLKDRFLM
jgi:predicted DCC family thiol-disulfide oxidoreductase YuxK